MTSHLRLRGGVVARRLLRRSTVLRSLAVQTLGRIQAFRDRGLPVGSRWEKHAPDEVNYWFHALQTPEMRSHFTDRLNPNKKVTTTSLRRALDEISAPDISILDVGSGPLTSVGKTYPGKSIEVTAVDPLADEYIALLRDLGIDAPVLPIACSGEHLLQRFAPGTFDVAYALNALDHSADPVAVLDNMLAVIKPFGRVALTHKRNEGHRNGYTGIHFWNIDCEHDHFLIWNQAERYDMTARLAERFEVDCWTSNDWVDCLICPRS